MSPLMRECLRYRKRHKTVVGIMTSPGEENEALALVVLPFVLATDDVAYYCSEHRHLLYLIYFQ